MKIYLILLSALLPVHYSSMAQSNAITKIRDIYTDIISHEKGYYQNKLTLNTSEQPWRGSGTFRKEVLFFYNDNPLHCDECGEHGEYALKKVVVTEQYDLRKYYAEYVYDEGILIFCFKKEEHEEVDENRYYYENNKLIRYIKNGSVFDSPMTNNVGHKDIQRTAYQCLDLFLKSFD